MSEININKEEIEKISGENLNKCWYCGKCSATCPFTDFMETPPHLLIRYALRGGSVEESKLDTPWVCASCFECTATCPVGIDISKVAEGYRKSILRKGEDHHPVRKIDKEELRKMPQILLVSEMRKHTR